LADDSIIVERVAATRLHELRRRVLRNNDPDTVVADPRDEESTSMHYAGLVNDRVVVCASFYPSNSPVDPSRRTYQLRYMATDFDQQGRGLATTVLRAAERDLIALGVQQVWANGRDTALGFYRATGWRLIEGSEHLSPETSLPHTVIVRDLDDN
jgi:GNAT superfamily N-acetyltransferase